MKTLAKYTFLKTETMKYTGYPHSYRVSKHIQQKL